MGIIYYIIYPKPYSIYLREGLGFQGLGLIVPLSRYMGIILYNIPKAIFYLLKGGFRVLGFRAYSPLK